MAAVCIKAKGVPYSISATYYTLDHKLIFGASMALTAMFLFPVIWEMSTTFTMRLLAIAACIGLIGVGLAPDFKDTWINRIPLWIGGIGRCFLLSYGLAARLSGGFLFRCGWLLSFTR